MDETLNYLFERTLIIPFLTGIIFVAAALVTLCFPPKKINYLYGYRTITSMKSQQVWDFAQRYSGIKMLQSGFLIMTLSFTNVFFDFNENQQVIFGLPLVIIPCIYLFWSTEKGIKKKFPNV
ncbi:SdpI family protein [Flavobacterium sp. 25HG05S-40]|uniref:SdpI family protein n=1 Tax=Flavobacterium sp. 25HG05S-40 TaxID=3458682 RepID=UPI0040443D6D